MTTFGEPRLGNDALVRYIDARFNMHDEEDRKSQYRRVTHVDDPVPLLPLREWHYRMHAGEIYISKAELPPSLTDLEHCVGDEDPRCIARADTPPAVADDLSAWRHEWWDGTAGMWKVPARFRIWQLFFAHRDYFWRLGLCVPGGDPLHWVQDESTQGRT